jgi:hypothetical protein
MSTTLTIQAGEPYARRIRVVDGKNIWATLDLFEVRCQVRDGDSEQYPLVSDLSIYFTPSYDLNDIVIDIAMTGQQTRTVGPGFYDVFLSDVGAVDARAIRILDGNLVVLPAVTAGS